MKPQGATIASNFTIVLSTVVGTGGLNLPDGIANAGDGSGRLFIIEKYGVIRIVENGKLLTAPFLDISDRVDSSGNDLVLGYTGLISIGRSRSQ